MFSYFKNSPVSTSFATVPKGTSRISSFPNFPVHNAEPPEPPAGANNMLPVF